MSIPIYQIDAFTNRTFGGNPAAICPLDHWLDDAVLQQIAIENNLAETAFFVQLPNGQYHLRWFTPEFEMDLCGHATLAAAFVLFEEMNFPGPFITFESQSGPLTVRKTDDQYELDFPSRPPEKATLPTIIQEGMGLVPQEVWKARDYVLLYKSEAEIRALQPDASILNQINLDPGGIVATAAGETEGVDFVSRFFTPQAVIFEDPVTGSAHCSLTPFWADRTGKDKLFAQQISARGGELHCELAGERVKLQGQAVKFLEGEIFV
ncbi:MAG: PhzF family phenazine biosynthesis protein [Bacteroidota bacterium]